MQFLSKPAKFRTWSSIVCLLLTAVPLADARQSNMLRMSEQLDDIDRADLHEILESAKSCIRRRDFACADASLAKARKLAVDNKDQAAWKGASEALTMERQAVERERYAAERERIRRENERQEAERLAAAREAEDMASPESAPDAGALIAAMGMQTLQNYANISATARAQQNAAIGRANEARVQREAQAERERQRNASERQRLANDSVRQAAENEAKQRSLLAEQAAQRQREQLAEEARERMARDKADRLAREEEARAANQRELTEYHEAMRRGIRLAATKCPDGEGHYYATGTTPRVKEPKLPSCIDVSYAAYCPANNTSSRGIARNFVGFSGCFGDTYKIDPKPACDVRDVQVQVTNVRSCS
jgi:hypothetical protein